MRRISIWILRFITVLAVVFLALFSWELNTFLSRNEAVAGKHIQIVFEEECNRRGVAFSEYEGPFLLKEDFWSYQFYWENKATREIALGQVQYFPIRTEIWFLPPNTKI